MNGIENIGRYPVYDKAWNRTGEYADTPTYPGQMAICFPSDWTPWECFLAGPNWQTNNLHPEPTHDSS